MVHCIYVYIVLYISIDPNTHTHIYIHICIINDPTYIIYIYIYCNIYIYYKIWWLPFACGLEAVFHEMERIAALNRPSCGGFAWCNLSLPLEQRHLER